MCVRAGGEDRDTDTHSVETDRRREMHLERHPSCAFARVHCLLLFSVFAGTCGQQMCVCVGVYVLTTDECILTSVIYRHNTASESQWSDSIKTHTLPSLPVTEAEKKEKQKHCLFLSLHT